jgi:hypothetical protein
MQSEHSFQRAGDKRGVMLTNAKSALITISCLVLISGVVNADTKVKSRQTSGGQTYENTSYIKGKRQRSETNNGQMIMIQQCDLRRNIQVMPQPRVYMVQPYDNPTTTTTNGTVRPVQPSTKGGVVTSTITTKDTGERKQMFGYTARHIITTMVMESSPDACSQTKSKMEFDGWYIDATFALECANQRTQSSYQPQPNGGCQDRYETKQIGTAKKGYPVWEKTTMFDANGNPSFSTLNEVIELSQATLDQGLFEIPEGYREVKDYASMYSAASSSSSASTGDNGSSHSGIAANVQSMASNNNSSASSTVGSKKEGIVRLGLATVKTGSVGEGLNARDLAAAVQNTLTKHLQDPKIEVVAIEAKLPSAIDAEAKLKECDYVIYANVSHKKGGGGFGGMFGSSTASIVGSSVGYGGGHAAVVATQVATQVAMSENIKAKDELTLDVKLQVPGTATTAFAKQYKAKAKSAGEDIITPVIEQAAQAIVDTAAKS